MAKYTIFIKIKEPLFFIDTNFQTKEEAEKEFKKALTKGTGFQLKLTEKNTQIIQIFDRDK